MLPERLHALLDGCGGDSSPLTPTLLYNEGWLLRLVLDWLARNEAAGHPLAFPPRARWYSEALLPTPFAARKRRDHLAEARTHADGVIGHFIIGITGKGDLSLAPDGTWLVVLEAKLGSPLSTGTVHAHHYDQAARSVACMAEVLRRAGRPPVSMSHLAFYVIAPASRVSSRLLAALAPNSIRGRIEERVSEYGGDKDEWLEQWLIPTVGRVQVEVLSWEDTLAAIAQRDPESGQALAGFYESCLRHSGM